MLERCYCIVQDGLEPSMSINYVVLNDKNFFVSYESYVDTAGVMLVAPYLY